MKLQPKKAVAASSPAERKLMQELEDMKVCAGCGWVVGGVCVRVSGEERRMGGAEGRDIYAFVRVDDGDGERVRWCVQCCASDL